MTATIVLKKGKNLLQPEEGPYMVGWQSCPESDPVQTQDRVANLIGIRGGKLPPGGGNLGPEYAATLDRNTRTGVHAIVVKNQGVDEAAKFFWR